MCTFQSHGMETNPSTVSIANDSTPDSDDRLQELLSALNLPALPTGGSRVRLIAIGDRASVKECNQPPAPLRHRRADVDTCPANPPHR